MALTQLLGGPDWDVVTNPDYALFADFHYFFSSGSVVRSNPWNSPQTPVAKILNVKNITVNDVALNYVSSSGALTSTTLTSGSTTQIISQTIPLGMDNNAWLSSSIVSNFTGSITPRPTGSRWFELESIRTVSQDTNVYTIADGDTTITKTNTGQPSVGSLRYRCSRTIPYLDQPFWLIRDLYDCAGGTTTTTSTTTTTTTTTSTTTTTTTIAPYCRIWTATNTFGSSYDIRVKYCGDTSYSFPTVPAGGGINVCVQNDQIDNNGNPILLTSGSIGCSGSIITTTTTTAAPTTTTTSTTTAGPTTTTTTTTLASQKYLLTSCIGDGDIIGVFTILNAPLLAPGDGIRIADSGIFGYYCFYVNNTSTGSSSGTYSITNIYPGSICDDCSE
jgi:hypothetical protein